MKIFRVLLALCLLLPLAARAADHAQAIPLTPEAQAAQTYLQSITTARARFKQTAPDGTQTTGIFYLHRPGRLRFQYDPPVKDYVVADGHFIYYWDGQLKQQSSAPIGQTLADFLLRKNLSFADGVSVTKIDHSDSGYLLVTLVQTNDPDAGSLTLAFTQGPLQLVKWRTVDATGAITEVELTDLQTGADLSDDLFYYRGPKGPAFND